jgi:hypothetical protein
MNVAPTTWPRTVNLLRRVITRLAGLRRQQGSAEAATSERLIRETRRWQFVAREAALISRLGRDLSDTTLPDDRRADAVAEIVRAAIGLRRFADARARRAALADDSYPTDASIRDQP